MIGGVFYHGTLKKYVTLFGTLFDNIYINRNDTVHGVIDTVKIPLMYAPMEKVLTRLQSDPDLTRPVATVVPRMSFEITTITYSPSRKLPMTGKIRKATSDAATMDYMYNPVPYDISFSLYIMVKNVEDGTQILEQILPYFTPDWTTTINVIPEMDIKQDIPLVLLNVTPQDTYEGNYDERRVITWTLDFIMKGYFYGPQHKAKAIKLSNTNFYDASLFDPITEAVGNTTPVSSFDVQPGLTANGEPTSNLSMSVATNEITANDNYGYIVSRG